MESNGQTPESLLNITSKRIDRKLNIKDESVRLTTFKNWPVSFISPASLARAGFYYLGTEDAVKCAYCSGIIAQWEDHDDPKTEHKKFFPQCPKVLMENNDMEDECGIQYGKPKSTNYATLDSRIRSFANWEFADKQEPEALARAGFYFLGLSDEVRCFYCDGGLRFWQEDDDPFYEHARYFEKCGYVRLMKGKAYIDKVLEEVLEKQVSEQTTTAEKTSSAATSNPVARTLDDAMNSEPVKQALQLGLDIGRIRMVSQRRINMTGTVYPTVEELIEDVLDGQIQDEGLSDRQLESQVTRLLLSAVSSVQLTTEDINQPSTSKSTKSPEVPVKISKPEDLKTDESNITLEEENKRLKSFRECKICMVSEVEIVFVPCGHLLSCVMCSTALSNCPLCRTSIKGRVRTFLS